MKILKKARKTHRFPVFQFVHMYVYLFTDMWQISGRDIHICVDESTNQRQIAHIRTHTDDYI